MNGSVRVKDNDRLATRPSSAGAVFFCRLGCLILRESVLNLVRKNDNQ